MLQIDHLQTTSFLARTPPLSGNLKTCALTAVTPTHQFLTSHSGLIPPQLSSETPDMPPTRPNTLSRNAKFPTQAVNTQAYTLLSHGRFYFHVFINEWESALRDGFQPSPQRHLPATLAKMAAGAQRVGAPLPTSPPRALTPDRAIEIARAIDPPRRADGLTSPSANRRNPN